MTSGAPSVIYKYIFRLPKQFWAQKYFGLLSYCGIKTKTVEIFGQMQKADDKKRAEYLEIVRNIVQDI